MKCKQYLKSNNFLFLESGNNIAVECEIYIAMCLCCFVFHRLNHAMVKILKAKLQLFVSFHSIPYPALTLYACWPEWKTNNIIDAAYLKPVKPLPRNMDFSVTEADSVSTCINSLVFLYCKRCIKISIFVVFWYFHSNTYTNNV